MRTLILTLSFLLAGCALSSEQRQTVGAGMFLAGQQMQQTVRDNVALNAYYNNQRLQQQQLFEMQQMNRNLMMQRYR